MSVVPSKPIAPASNDVNQQNSSQSQGFRRRGRGRSFRNRSRNNGRRNTGFKGETEGMNANVFESLEESRDPTQYNRTLEALERYCFKNYTSDLGSLFGSSMALPVVPLPVSPEPSADKVQQDIYQLRLKNFIKLETEMVVSLKSLWAVVWGQCSPAVITKLEENELITSWKASGDVCNLLEEIKLVCMRFEQKRSLFAIIRNQKQHLLNYRQEGESLHKYLEVYKSLVDNIKRFGGELGTDVGLVKEMMLSDGLSYETDYANLGDDDKEDLLKRCEDKYLAVCFLLGGSIKKYGSLVADLQNSYLMGDDKFPTTVAESYQMMANYTAPPNEGQTLSSNSVQSAYGYMTGMSFAQTDGKKEVPVPGVDGILHPNIICFKCQKPGHYKNQCPIALTQLADDEEDNNNTAVEDVSQAIPRDVKADKNVSFGFVQVAVSMFQEEQNRYKGLSRDWVLLDTQSNCDIFNNPNLLSDIRVEEGPGLTLHSNGDGTVVTNMVGDLPGYGKVWFSSKSIANILSFSNVRKRFKVEIKTGPEDESPAIKVTRSNGTVMSFEELSNGLYVCKANIKNNNTVNKVIKYTFVNTVEEREDEFTIRQVDEARKAIVLYRRIGRPSKQSFFKILENNLIRDCPVTSLDAKRAEYIYGLDVACLKGRTRRKKPNRVPSVDIIPLPEYVLQWHSNVTLCVDCFYINKMAFLHTISRDICFRTVEYLAEERKSFLLSGIRQVIKFYEDRGLVVQCVRGDGQFACLKEDLRPVILQISAAGEHVPEVERSIQTVKNDCRTLFNSLPYERFPPILIKNIVEYQVRYRNLFPAQNGVSNSLSPTSIMTGMPPPSYADFPLSFGEYVQVHDHPSTTNDMNPRTTGAIAMGPENRQGGWKFMTLSTGSSVLRYKWTPLPTPNDVILRVHELADELKLKNKPTNSKPTFEWGNGVPIEMSYGETSNDMEPPDNVNDDESDDYENHGEEPVEDVIDDPIEHDDELVDEEVFENSENPENSNVENDFELNVDNDINDDFEADDSGNIGEERSDRLSFEDQRSAQDRNDEAQRRDPRLRQNPKSIRDGEFEKRHYNFIQARKPKLKSIDQLRASVNKEMKRLVKGQYCHENRLRRDLIQLCHKVTESEDALCLNQMSAREGIKMFGDRALAAMVKEYGQLHDLQVFSPRNPLKLSKKEKVMALNAIDLIKEKRCGKIKGRTVADGRKQRNYYNKIDTSSPALSMDGFLTSLIIDAFEKRNVATADIAGAFLKAEMNDYVLVRLRGPAVQALISIDKEKYSKFVTQERGENVLYVQLLKAMYGTLTAPLLWYELFAKTLVGLGFEINPYDTCVANKIIANKQFTVCWYVDDLKLSHSDENEVTKMIDILESKFGKMNVVRGDKHTYLGMNFEIDDGKVKLLMQDYLHECIEAFGEEVQSNIKTPSTKNLMEVKENEDILDEEKHRRFHSIVQKLLYVSKRARLDLQLTIGFLCTRVKAPTVSDWEKLRRLLGYVKNTLDLPRIMSLEGFDRMDVYIDAAHASHVDMRGQTGGTVVMGTGVVHSRSSKQSINTKSSTETELVGVSDYIPYAIWLLNFLEKQGYKIHKRTLKQDKQSTIKILKNGQKSCGKQSRHIKVRYFWISDRLQEEVMEVEYCPTQVMLADFFTKPLQGRLFRIMRDVVQGIGSLDQLIIMYEEKLFNDKSKEVSPFLSDKERVEVYKNQTTKRLNDKNDHNGIVTENEEKTLKRNKHMNGNDSEKLMNE